MMTSHLTSEQLIGYIYHMLTDIEREDVDLHLAECAECRSRLTEQEATYRRIHYSVIKLRRIRPPESTSYAAVETRLRRSKKITKLWAVSGQVMAAAGFVIVFGLVVMGLINMLGGSPQPVTTAISSGTTFRGNPQRTGTYDVLAVPRRGELAWTFETENAIWTSPVMAGETVYINSTDKMLYALDGKTGQQKWAFAQKSFAFSSPTIGDQQIYVGDGFYLYAVDTETGVEKWRYEAKLISNSPVVVDNTVYVGQLMALNAETGDLKWEFPISGYVYSSPAVANGVVYIGSGWGYLYAVDADTGQELWKFKTSAAIESTPMVANGVVYVGSNDTRLYAIDAETGELKWKFKTDSFIFSSPAIANGVVYVGSGDYHLYAVDAESGELKWKFKTGMWVKSSPAVADGMVYFGSFDKYFYAVDSRTGELVWKYKTEAGVKSSPLIAEGIVYFGSEDGTLYAVR